MNSGDTAFVLISAAMVMFMVPGLALFYGGMVRAKNVLATVVQSFFALGLVSVLWVLVAYSLAFGPDIHHVIGGLSFAGFNGVGQTTNALAPTVPHQAFAVFQLFFAAITPAIITGAFAERMKFSAFAVFTALWLLLIYAPLAHWVWAPDGWLHQLGALDFAGGTVVHISSGIAGLAAVVVLGKRHGHGQKPMVPHNLPLTMLGAGMLWFGWFGFNAGSALSAGGLAANAFITTNTAAGAAMLGWVIVDWQKQRKVTTVGAVSGAIAGLVAITPAAGFVNPLASIFIGLAAGIGCAYAVNIKLRTGYDDALDVVGVHAVGGIIGALLIGIFATKAVNPAGANGLLSGGGLILLGKQALAVSTAVAFSFAGSWVLLKAIDLMMGLRVSTDEEHAGLDLAQHEEAGYVFVESDGLLKPRHAHAKKPRMKLATEPVLIEE
jgi:Amt family ammonium transporter